MGIQYVFYTHNWVAPVFNTTTSGCLFMVREYYGAKIANKIARIMGFPRIAKVDRRTFTRHLQASSRFWNYLMD